MSLATEWKKELKNHAGDYSGFSEEYDLECAFIAGWMAAKRDNRNEARK